MLKIAGSNSRTFTFPADVDTALCYYRDIPRLITFLPHIELHEIFADNQYRMVYSAKEMGAYTITIYADVQATVLEREGIIRILPLNGHKPMKSRASFNATQVQGYYASEGIFIPEGDKTLIEYTFELLAEPPRPKGLRFMPGVMVDGIAQNITHWRVREIVDGFIANSLAAFPTWQEARRDGHAV